MKKTQTIIEEAFEHRAEINPRKADTLVKEAVEEALSRLDEGEARVAEKKDGEWVVNEWLKKAVLLSFRLSDNVFVKGGYTNYFDKVPSKYADYSSRDFRKDSVRIVPPASVRKGAFIAPNVVLMPSYVNIGAYVDSGTMVDTWATVGSCAQIGKNVHLRRGRYRRGTGTPPGQTHHYRRQLLHWSALRNRRRGHCGRRICYLHGSIHWPKHQNLSSRNGRG